MCKYQNISKLGTCIIFISNRHSQLDGDDKKLDKKSTDHEVQN